MNIRHATIDDLDAIVEIYNQAIEAGQRTADTAVFTVDERMNWFMSHSPDKYPLFVAVENGEVIGYLTIEAYRPGRMALQYAAEVSYYIHFDHHRKGVGSTLLEHAIHSCPSLNIKTLIAILVASNEGSVRLLEQFGFREWGRLPRVAEFDGIEIDHLYYGLRME